ncbi:hypothetical protein [Bifidobacterium sp. ESL0790]|uniref:hypothetical protein n=1 Tax=Bifidobacterium sp. ESL0790 TaxID=2983233 RepID=UPI0023F993AB|nr:hypothetical protein [Bifidobacterium sp. ESL0790]WEV72456.1 hypothetical protein OZY47_00200 [Bifidobacterium sp. ESL0790]
MRGPSSGTGAILDTYLEASGRVKGTKARKETAAKQARTGDEPDIGTGIDWNEFRTATDYAAATD